MGAIAPILPLYTISLGTLYHKILRPPLPRYYWTHLYYMVVARKPSLRVFILIHILKTLKTMNYPFLNRNFALKLQGDYWKDDVVTITAHLRVTIKPLTRYKQTAVLASMSEGKSMPSNMVANTNPTTLLKNQSAIKYLPCMRYLSNFGCKIIFKRSVIFFINRIPSHCFWESAGHMTS